MRTIALIIGLLACAALPSPFVAAGGRQQQRGAPLDLRQVRELVRLMPDEALAGEIAERGIGFEVTEELITELSRGGAGARTVAALRALIPNRSPSVVLSLEADEVERGQSLTCAAEASDPEGDELRYEWSATAGTVEGDGPLIRLNTAALDDAAETSQLTVAVTVRDGRGGSTTASRTVLVHNRRARRVRTPLRIAGEGKYLLVYIAPDTEARPSGSVAVFLNAPDAGVGPGNLVGGLPGKPCRVRFGNPENVAELSLKEAPGAGNNWGALVARVRPKNPRRSIRFTIGWEILRDIPD